MKLRREEAAEGERFRPAGGDFQGIGIYHPICIGRLVNWVRFQGVNCWAFVRLRRIGDRQTQLCLRCTLTEGSPYLREPRARARSLASAIKSRLDRSADVWCRKNRGS